MKLGAQFFTLRDFTKTEEGMYESLKKVKEIGYNYVQLSGGGYNTLDKGLIKSQLDELGLKVFVTHNAYSTICNETKKLIEEHKMMGAEFIGLGSMPGEFRGSKEGMEAYLKGIIPACKEIRDAGLKFVYHNHRFEFMPLDMSSNYTLMDLMLDSTDADYYGLLMDTYWIHNGGKDVVKYINDHADRLEVVHFKDYGVDAEDKEQMREIGKGNLNWDAIIPACEKAGVKYVAVEQDVCPYDPFECLKVSYEFLKDKFED